MLRDHNVEIAQKTFLLHRPTKRTWSNLDKILKKQKRNLQDMEERWAGKPNFYAKTAQLLIFNYLSTRLFIFRAPLSSCQ